MPGLIPLIVLDKLLCLFTCIRRGYHWTHYRLKDPNIVNPLVSPSVNTNYIVAVGAAGCSKTKQIPYFVKAGAKPPFRLVQMILICLIDTLQLNAGYRLPITWWPNYNINNLAIPSPLVSLIFQTMYHVQLVDTPINCCSEDSVYVGCKDRCYHQCRPRHIYMQTGRLHLRTTSDALHYKWVPSAFLNNDTIKRILSPVRRFTTTCIKWFIT